MTADPIVVVSGACTAIVTAVLGYLGASRGRKTQAAAELVDQVRDWATQLQESEEKCRSELNVLRVQLDEVRKELDQVRKELDQVKRTRPPSPGA